MSTFLLTSIHGDQEDLHTFNILCRQMCKRKKILQTFKGMVHPEINNRSSFTHLFFQSVLYNGSEWGLGVTNVRFGLIKTNCVVHFNKCESLVCVWSSSHSLSLYMWRLDNDKIVLFVCTIP